MDESGEREEACARCATGSKWRTGPAGAFLAAIATGALVISGCNAKAKDQLLASELIYRDERDGWTRTVQIDPWLGHRPALVRQIRALRISAMLTADQVCSTTEQIDCSESASFEVQHDGKRFVSLLETTDVFSGGAHGYAVLRDHLYDLGTGKELRFGDLFDSWASVRSLIQRELCAQIELLRGASECPDVQEQAITLSSAEGEKVSSFTISTQDYALGSYADGRDQFNIDLTPAMYEHLKPEYRVEFEVSGTPQTALGASQLNRALAGDQDESVAFTGVRGPGSCKAGDTLQFTGKWIMGASGVFPLQDPASDFENFLAHDVETQATMSRADPLRINWQDGCTGITNVGPTTLHLSQPLGGGTIHGGKFLAAIFTFIDDGGRKRSCPVVVRSDDVICPKG